MQTRVQEFEQRIGELEEENKRLGQERESSDQTNRETLEANLKEKEEAVLKIQGLEARIAEVESEK